MDAGHWQEILRGIYGGRRWIVARDVLPAMGNEVAALKELGAAACLCVASSRGTGDPPDPDFAPDPVVLDVRAEGLMGGIRASLEALAALPEWAVERTNRFDPDGTAAVIGGMVDDGRPLAGRRKLGARPAAWQRLEDKTVVDVLWDAAGVRRSPSAVVPARADELARASAELDGGAGCVWAGDNREGFHGGGTYLRWVRDQDSARAAAAFFEAHCERARVMPFLEGIPCSIHGMVFPEAVAVFRPCEMLVFRKPGAELHYAGAASFWDPREADREAMREVARTVGEHLRSVYGYRGMFTIDGVLAREGFLPTELNPRVGAAARKLTVGLGLSLELVHLALVEGEAADWRPDALERLVVGHADANRRGGGMALVARRFDDVLTAELVVEDEGDETCRRAGDGEEPDIKVTRGPGSAGGFVMATLVPERTPVGPSAAPRVIAALSWADAEWDLAIGPLRAEEVRPG